MDPIVQMTATQPRRQGRSKSPDVFRTQNPPEIFRTHSRGRMQKIDAGTRFSALQRNSSNTVKERRPGS